MKMIEPNEKHAKFKADMEKLLRRHAGHLSAMEMLAVASKMVGMIIALQDQKTVTAEMAMQCVTINIELGHKDVINGLTQTQGNA